MSGPSPRPPLDPQAARFLEKLRAARLPPIDQIPIREARALSASTVVTADEVGSVETLPIDGGDSELQVRLYRPPEGTPPHQAGASIVFFHGGGWVLGSIDSHDGLCRRLCRLSRCTVMSVDYRLAPEHPFPAAVRDADRAVRWVARNAAALQIDPGGIAVCGDSAGANLATVAARHVTGEITLRAQILWYPVTGIGLDTPSYHENSEGYFLSRTEMGWFLRQYLQQPGDHASPDASPLLAENLAGLPPTYLLTAGYDPLRDDGRQYAKRLIDSGVSLHFVERPGLIHGFMRRLDDFPQATEVLQEVSQFLSAIPFGRR